MSKSEAAPMIHQFTLDTLEFNLTSFIMSWLAVNANGERYGAEMPFEPMLTNARMNNLLQQQRGLVHPPLHGRMRPEIMQQQPERYDRFTDGLDAVMEKWLGNGKLIKADTLDDLAKQLISRPTRSGATTSAEQHGRGRRGRRLRRLRSGSRP